MKNKDGNKRPVRMRWMGWLAGPALSQKISRYSACPLKNSAATVPASKNHPSERAASVDVAACKGPIERCLLALWLMLRNTTQTAKSNPAGYLSRSIIQLQLAGSRCY